MRWQRWLQLLALLSSIHLIWTVEQRVRVGKSNITATTAASEGKCVVVAAAAAAAVDNQ